MVRTSSVGMVESSRSKVEKYLARKKVRFKNSVKELKLLLMEKQPGLLKVIKDFLLVKIYFLIYFKVHMLYVVDDTFDDFYVIVKSCDSGGGVIGKPLVVVVRRIISRGKSLNCSAILRLVICQVNVET